MIKLSNLSKTYKSKNRLTCKALDDLSFVLPDKGFVFIIGKSGSGKSTLLNMIGGLDSKTSGEIIVDNHVLTDFSTREYDDYRNEYVGFIFQDFHLIDDLTIFDNVKLALSLQGQEDDELVEEALEKVDLAGYGNRYPRELSGGQKQRVAIARALVKDPKVILADEPTGNLDKTTTMQILDLLKKLSEEILVCIVSHNMNDANMYADRIIELADGKVINHLKRNENYNENISVVGDTLVIPYLKKLSDSDREYVRKVLARGEVKDVLVNDEIFSPSEELTYKSRGVRLSHMKFKTKEKAKLAYVFTKSNILRTILSSFILACILVVLGLSQLIVQFDGNKVIANEMKDSDNSNLVLHKNQYRDGSINSNSQYIVEIEDGDVDDFISAGYKGNVYKLVNYAMSTKSTKVFYENKPLLITPSNIYPSEVAGVLITNKEYVAKLFGSFELILEADELDTGVYITDYLADTYLANLPHKFSSYNDLLGDIIPGTAAIHGYIKGIIKTNYKERYRGIIEKISDKNLTSEERNELVNNEDFVAFYEEAINFLSIGYAFNQDFLKDVSSGSRRNIVQMNLGTFTVGKRKYIIENKMAYIESYFKDEDAFNVAPENLKDNQMMMNYITYNEVFGTNYTEKDYKTFKPHTATYTGYRRADTGMSKALFTIDVEIVGLTSTTSSSGIFVADNLFRYFETHSFFTYGLYFDNVDNAGIVNEVGEKNGYVANSIIVSALATMTKAVSVFSDFFELILVFLCIACALILINFNVRTIKGKLYEIGIIKALGGKTLDLGLIFGVQVLLVGILTCIFYVLGSVMFIGLANDVLVSSLSLLAPSNYIVIDCDFLILDPNVMGYDCMLIMVIVIVTLVVPFVILRSIKPTNIIKAKE